MALKFLHDALARVGEPLPALPGFPSGYRGVSGEIWRAECAARGLVDPDSKTRRASDIAFKRATTKLLAVGKVASRDGWWEQEHGTPP